MRLAVVVQRYGPEEVRRWWFETWNEANLSIYWKGTPEEFYKEMQNAGGTAELTLVNLEGREERVKIDTK